MIVLADGQNGVTREYVELLAPDESEKSALERWARAHPDMHPEGKARQRNVEKTLARLMAEPLYVKLCHPSSWWREQYASGAIERPKRRRGRR